MKRNDEDMMIVAIVQARMGSSRLPGKVLKDILGKPMLWHVVQRLRNSRLIDEVTVATSTNPNDTQIMEFAEENGIRSFAGSEEDVLDRVYQAASHFKADVIVRITSDCPLIDPEITDVAISYFLEGGFDFTHTGLSFPDGVADTEVFSYAVLERAWKDAKKRYEREHVTPYIHNNPQLFRIGVVENNEDLSHLRLTVDREEDLTLVRKIYGFLYKPRSVFHLEDILKLLKEKPEILEINKDVPRFQGYYNIIREDRSSKDVRKLGADLSKDIILRAVDRLERQRQD